MSSPRAEQTAAGNAGVSDGLEEGLEVTVAAYLRGHPDFFERHSDILTHLRVPHASGGVVSLIEHQVGVLRKQLDTERGRLAHLISRAREYESQSMRLHGLVLQLIPAADKEQLDAALQDALCKEFSAVAVTLKLFPLAGSQDADPDPLTASFQDFLERKHALCGPLDEGKSQVLFGPTGEEVKSAALVPIRADGQSGVLAIGAADAERFRPEMGTDLLDRLGEIVSLKLRTLTAGE